VAYDRVNYMGGELPHPSVVAVPCVEMSGNFVSQTMAIMELLADELGYLTPSKHHNKALQSMYNIYDIGEQAATKRKEIKTRAEAAQYVDSRMAQFFVAIEAGYKQYAGVYFYSDKPCMVDFQLLACIIALKSMFGDEPVAAMLVKVSPTANAAAETLAGRPNVKKFIDSKFKGLALLPPSMKADSSLLVD
jgi:glutathione S-transferase